MNFTTKIVLALGFFAALPAMADQVQNHDMRAAGERMHADAGDAAAGRPGDPAKVSRTVKITMDDTMRFTPSRISVKAGETIRFFVVNTGRLRHEMVIGSKEELKEHAAQMRRMPNMQHAEPNQISLAAGQRGGLVWQFDKPGNVTFACLQPGHMESGMVGKIEVK